MRGCVGTGCVLLVLLMVVVSAQGLGMWRVPLADAHVGAEWLLGETPTARVNAYLRAVGRGRRADALALWPEQERLGPEYEARRQGVTDALLAMRPFTARIVDVQWWRNCCEPGLAQRPAGAGVARVRVQVVDPQGARATYVLDVIAIPTPYWGPAGGPAVRRWVLRDVYPLGERPLAFPWVTEADGRPQHATPGGDE